MSEKELNYVRFDVGHYLHVCHKGTIKKYDNSFLAKLIAPEFDRRKSEAEYIVIDRDGKHFGSILNYMRDETCLNLDGWSDSDLTDLMREADYYCLVDLVELCEKQFEGRDLKVQSEIAESSRRSYVVPANKKLEIIYGASTMRELLAHSTKPTIVISYKNIRRYHIDSWIEECVKLCDHSRCKVYCYSNKNDEQMCDKGLSDKDFIMSVYDPEENRFLSTLTAPPIDKFRDRRGHYKCKIFKFWFLVQNDVSHLTRNSV